MQADFTTAPEVIEAQQATGALAALADGYVVATAEQYTHAGDDLKRIKGAQKKLEGLRTSFTAPLNATVKRINEFFAAPKAKLDTAERTIKGRMISYQTEQDRIRREQQAKLEAEARKERERLEAQAREAERKAREKADAERRAAEEAAAAGRAEEAARLAAKAAATEAKAAEKADALQERAATVVAPVIQAEPPKVTGVSNRDVWKFEITDPAALPREYTLPDEKKIGAVVRAMKGDTAISGVRVWAEKQLAAGAA